jgi:hypothetical protein
MFHETQFLPGTCLFLIMARKKWTPQTDITPSLINSREKRKWQLSFRRYVLEKMPGGAYAPYFGLDIVMLRQWFELQFTAGLTWENFGKAWQFDHVVPTSYFDYSNEHDLKLCWSFINVRVAALQEGKPTRTVDLLTIRPHFQSMFDKTGYSLCAGMLKKISEIEAAALNSNSAIEEFIHANIDTLSTLNELDHDQFNRLNQGTTLEALLLERDILRKFS